MATMTLPAPIDAANPAIVRTSHGLTKTTTHAVEMARLHLRNGNPGGYARTLAGEHRATSTRQQTAIEAVIASDGLERLFVRHVANGCLLAKENLS